jgi:hypothetical protein
MSRSFRAASHHIIIRFRSPIFSPSSRRRSPSDGRYASNLPRGRSAAAARNPLLVARGSVHCPIAPRTRNHGATATSVNRPCTDPPPEAPTHPSRPRRRRHVTPPTRDDLPLLPLESPPTARCRSGQSRIPPLPARPERIAYANHRARRRRRAARFAAAAESGAALVVGRSPVTTLKTCRLHSRGQHAGLEPAEDGSALPDEVYALSLSIRRRGVCAARVRRRATPGHRRQRRAAATQVRPFSAAGSEPAV